MVHAVVLELAGFVSGYGLRNGQGQEAAFRISLARRSSRFSRSSSGDPATLLGRELGSGAALDLGLADPVAERLGTDPGLGTGNVGTSPV